jgi:hypothetical protein
MEQMVIFIPASSLGKLKWQVLVHFTRIRSYQSSFKLKVEIFLRYSKLLKYLQKYVASNLIGFSPIRFIIRFVSTIVIQDLRGLQRTSVLFSLISTLITRYSFAGVYRRWISYVRFPNRSLEGFVHRRDAINMRSLSRSTIARNNEMKRHARKTAGGICLTMFIATAAIIGIGFNCPWPIIPLYPFRRIRWKSYVFAG